MSLPLDYFQRYLKLRAHGKIGPLWVDGDVLFLGRDESGHYNGDFISERDSANLIDSLTLPERIQPGSLRAREVERVHARFIK